MKLLLDENLSHRLAPLLSEVYPGTTHVRNVGLLGAPDEDIWRFAATHDFVVVSKDADFFQRSTRYGSPPKVIWLRIGNSPTRAIARLLRERYVTVRRFHDDEAASLLPLQIG